MVDPVIDEHFRRSLGADYMNLFGKKQETQQPSPNVLQSKNTKVSTTTAAKNSQPTTAATNSITGKMSSNKWPASSPSSSSTNVAPSIPVKPESFDANDESETSDERMEISDDSATTVEMSVDDHFAKALGDTWKRLQQAEKNSSNLTNTTTKTTSANDNENLENRKLDDNDDFTDNDSNDSNDIDEDDDDNSSDSSNDVIRNKKK